MSRITFGNWENTTPPAWAGDFFDRNHLVPGGARIVPASFLRTDGVTVQTSAATLAGVTAIPVDALSGPIPSGTMLRFAAGVYARLTADAAAGATSLTVEATPANIGDDAVATYEGAELRTIPSGTLVGRTFTERDAGTAFGPAASSDDEIYIVAFDITDADANPDVELYRYGSIVKENYLPGWATMSAPLKAALRARYQTTKGGN